MIYTSPLWVLQCYKEHGAMKIGNWRAGRKCYIFRVVLDPVYRKAGSSIYKLFFIIGGDEFPERVEFRTQDIIQVPPRTYHPYRNRFRYYSTVL